MNFEFRNQKIGTRIFPHKFICRNVEIKENNNFIYKSYKNRVQVLGVQIVHFLLLIITVFLSTYLQALYLLTFGISRIRYSGHICARILITTIMQRRRINTNSIMNKQLCKQNIWYYVLYQLLYPHRPLITGLQCSTQKG